MGSVPLRIKFLVFTFLALIGTAVMTKSGLEQAGQTAQMAKLSDIVTLTKDQLRTDMMHDAMHGNVLQALAEVNNPAEVEKITAEAEENAQTAIEAFKEIDALQLTPEFEKSFADLEVAYMNYVSEVRKMLEVVKAQNPNAQQIYKTNFLPAFEGLAEEAEALQEVVDKYSKEKSSVGLEESEEAVYIFEIVAAVSVLISLGLPIYSHFALFAPQRKLLKIAECLSGSNADRCEDIPYKNRHDEIGQLAHTLITMRKNIEARLNLANNFEKNVKGAVDAVASASTEMESTARQMSDMVRENEDKMSELSIAVTSAAQNISHASAAIQQIYASINEISKQVSEASLVNSDAAKEAQSVNKIAEHLSLAAGQVNSINSVITSISDKINLLSLNATIEAARAGEYGKGFAVVASEVKSLAGQTATSASQVSKHIESIQSSSSETLNGVKTIRDVIEKINTISSTIAAAIEEQDVGTKDVAKNIKEASENATTISENVSFAAKTAQNNGKSAEQMLVATTELSKQAETLRSEVDSFLNSLRNG